MASASSESLLQNMKPVKPADSECSYKRMALRTVVLSLAFSISYLLFKISAPSWGWFLAAVILGIPLYIVFVCTLASDGGYTSVVDMLLCPHYPVHMQGAILITGASRGLGFDTAIYLEAKGFTVLGTVRSEKDAEKLRSLNKRIIPIMMDQTKPETVDAAFQMVRQQPETLVAVICNAGLTTMGCVEGLPFDPEALGILETNVVGGLRVIKAFLTLIRQNKGRIIVLGAPDAPLNQYTYKMTANGALHMMTKALRTDLGGKSVSVSIIQPAGTAGNMAKEARDKTLRNREKYMSQEIQALYPAPKLFTEIREEKLFSPDWVSAAIYHALTAKKPKTQYTTTPVGTMLFFWSSILPARAFETMICKLNALPY